MFVGVYRIEIFLPDSHSLKDKRSVLTRLKTRLRDLGVSTAEVDGQDLWQRAVLGVAAVSAEPRWLDDLPARMGTILERDPRITVLRVIRDVRPVEMNGFGMGEGSF